MLDLGLGLGLDVFTLALVAAAAVGDTNDAETVDAAVVVVATVTFDENLVAVVAVVFQTWEGVAVVVAVLFAPAAAPVAKLLKLMQLRMQLLLNV